MLRIVKILEADRHRSLFLSISFSFSLSPSLSPLSLAHLLPIARSLDEQLVERREALLARRGSGEVARLKSRLSLLILSFSFQHHLELCCVTVIDMSFF